MLIQTDALEVMAVNSHRNFHTRGLDYVCLRRSTDLTVKAYFLDGGRFDLSEVVNPHDHRYNFTTAVMSGRVSNKRYAVDKCGAATHFVRDWLTPLNGGDGFGEAKPSGLSLIESLTYRSGDIWSSPASEIHTLSVVDGQCCIILRQYKDVIPVGEPTRTWFKTDDKPTLSGLYEVFTPDQITQRLKHLADLGVITSPTTEPDQ